MTHGSQDHEKLLKKLRRYPVAVYSTIGLVGVMMVIIPYLLERNTPGTQFTANSIISDLGTGIIGAVLIFFVLHFFLLSENQTNENFDSVLKEHLSKTRSDLVQEVQKLNSYVPEKIYPASQSPGHDYNRDVDRDVASSTFFIYKGTTAKYAPVRIARLTRPRSQTFKAVQIFMVDPKNERTIRQKARDRQQKPHYASKSIPELVKGLQEEIYLTVYGLYQCRAKCETIMIYYDNSITSLISFEIFDKHTYMSFYQTSDSYTSKFPSAVRYTSDSIYHDMYKTDCERLASLFGSTSGTKFTITDDTDESALWEHLKNMGCTIPPDEFPARFAQVSEFYEQGVYGPNS